MTSQTGNCEEPCFPRALAKHTESHAIPPFKEDEWQTKKLQQRT